MMNKHIGSNFDDFLAEEGLQEEVTAAAIKRVIAWQLSVAMKARRITKTEMATRMHTSRMVVARLLDANDTSVTLATLARASVAVGIPLKIEMAGYDRPASEDAVVAAPRAVRVGVSPKGKVPSAPRAAAAPKRAVRGRAAA